MTTLLVPSILTATDIQQVTLQTAIENFVRLEYPTRSAQTRDWYSKRLGLFCKALNNCLLSDVLETDLLTWYNNVLDSNLAIETKHGYIRAVRRFFRWLTQHHIILNDMTRNLRLPTIPKRGRKGVADNTAQRMLEAACDHHPRDYALLLFLEATGARRGGAARLRFSDLDLDNGQATIIEKGNKERIVFLNPPAIRAFQEWLPLHPGGEYVFANLVNGKKMSVGGISEILRRYKDRLEINDKCSPHQWRHRFVRKLVKAGMPLNQASQIAGHSSVVVTAEFYGTFNTDELRDAYDKYQN